MQRGAPETLVLAKLNPAMTVLRAPGPGSTSRSYKMKSPGVVHDAVVHKKKRVKQNGKWVWLKPTFVRILKHALPDGRRISCKAGTQLVDRAWKFIKARLCRNQYVKSSSLLLTAQICSAQWEYWNRHRALWLCTGHVVASYMEGMVKR